jgi:hypothetical protein
MIKHGKDKPSLTDREEYIDRESRSMVNSAERSGNSIKGTLRL